MKILTKYTHNDAKKFGLTSGANPGKTHGIGEVPPSPTDSDNTTATGAKTEPQDGNKLNETAQEEKTNERGDSLFSHIVDLWIYIYIYMDLDYERTKFFFKLVWREAPHMFLYWICILKI